MNEALLVNELIAQQYAQSVLFAIFIASTLLAGVTLSALLWRTQARLQALEDAMRLQSHSVRLQVLQMQESTQMQSVKDNTFRSKTPTQIKAESRPLTTSRIPPADSSVARTPSADPTAALSPIARTRNAESTTRPRHTGIVPFRTQAQNVLSNDAGARHHTNDAFEQDQHIHRVHPSGT